MRLTNLEIKGFKSFAEKTVINFDNGITGVVGPNGCGKSNVVDAIRWVLGEQKAKTLRLEKMDNIIFNGTKDRKQGHIAEVSLTLDNTKNLIPTEFTSIKITRALHRSGDSEYKLNGVSCRLKDIRDLFLDTGISTSTYAIIELKMIDDILNDVDGSRRRLFEQAAGISKYKARKKETLGKLQSTEGDLNRVEDLLFEIEGNLKSLEKQARKAQKYKLLKEDYKLLSIDLAKYEFTGLQQGLAGLKEQRQEVEDKRQAVETSLLQVEAKIQETKTTILDKEKSLADQQKLVNELIAKIQETESDKRVKAQKSEFLNERIERLRLLIQNNNNEIQNLQSEIQNLSDSDSSGYEELDGLRQIQEQAQIALEKFRTEHAEMNSGLQSKRDAYLNVRQDLYDIEKQIVAKETRIENLVQNSQKNIFENKERRLALTTLEAEIKTYQLDLSKESKVFDQLKKAEDKNLQEQNIAREKVEKIRQEIADTNRILDAKNNEYKLTKNMIDNLEGFPESIKFLKKNAFWLKEAPLLSDILYSDEKYRVSLETVLNPYLNNYIVDTEEDALNAISLLNDSSVGKASFFVLDLLKDRKEGQPIKHENLIPAIDIVEADDKFKKLLAYLLESVYFLKDKTDFSTLPEDLIAKNDLFIINENGTLLKSKTTISGGAVGLFEGKKLGRVKNLEKLQKEISKLQKSLLKHKDAFGIEQKKLSELRNNQLRKEVETAQRTIQNIEKELVVRNSKMENFHDLLSKHATHEDEMSTTIEEEQSILSTAKEKHKILSQKVEQDKAALETLESAFKEKNDLLQQRQQEFNKVNIEYLQKEGTLKSQKQSLNFKSTRLEEIDKSITNAQQEQQECESQINALLQEMKDLEQKLLDQYKHKETLNKDLTVAETAYYEIKGQVQEYETETFEKRKQRDELDRIIQNTKDKFNDLKFELESLRQRLSIEFNIEASKIDTEDLPKISKEELSTKVEKVKKRIDNYGDVNPMAEEAYDEMKTRFDFITEQKADLTDAKDSLLQTIKEIEDTAEGHFMETFNAVKENFKMVFQSMFTEGDTCDLTLLDPEDPLETKIEISAKPKGKRPQSINQLSGGEKTLTSLSLLFALYLYKPAPFCILDEVDAPLDDANIDKFNKAIRNFSKNSQFIIVTHNKQTMAEVDVIYGVTMAQKGVSKVVPVDFRSLSAN